MQFVFHCSKDVSCIRFDPMARLYSVSVETEHERQDRGLVSLLNAHSFGVPLIVGSVVHHHIKYILILRCIISRYLVRIYLHIYPPITRKRSKCYNELVQKLPTTCLPHIDRVILLSAFPNGTASKLTGLFSTVFL